MTSKVAGNPVGKHLERDGHGRFAPKTPPPAPGTPPVEQPPAPVEPPPADGSPGGHVSPVRRLLSSSLGDLIRGR